ncbi:lipoate-protein ligase 2, putative [Plasmodium vivax]|uniref:BPL/LPL catalytic domain-containing protein n=1 Tax=Plasmodium vivax (strain Brazil I) TaxID=1033975 RepID=A0A0J9SX93_PLAV1|nr:hypothetical protein PVBG_04155 [Plasmodium vivax Brazil I]CAI7719677.1 lipoate-protein ligase 2, putative [Plasmodium vivax]
MSRLSRIFAARAVSELFRPLAPQGGGKKVLYLLNLTKLHVYEQLLLEECLYRMSTPLSQGENNVGFVLINDTYSGAKEGGGEEEEKDEEKEDEEDEDEKFTPPENKCIVLGISGKVANFIRDVDYIGKNKIALIRRYTGGGTVFIRNNCLMFSLILPFHFEEERQLYSSNVAEWVFNSFYHPVFNATSGVEEEEKREEIPNRFIHHQNDYVHLHHDHVHDAITMKKVGGNAQAFSKNYFAHHTSLLWSCDYDEMERVITNPCKQPLYRNGRNHRDFLTSLEECLPGDGRTPKGFIGKFVSNIRRLINQKNDQSEGPFWHFHRIDLGIHGDSPIAPGDHIFDEVHSVDATIWRDLFRSFCSSEETKNLRSTRLLDPLGGVLPDGEFCGPSFLLR